MVKDVTAGLTLSKIVKMMKALVKKGVQCPHSKEEDSVATICGFGDKFYDLRVQTQ